MYNKEDQTWIDKTGVNKIVNVNHTALDKYLNLNVKDFKGMSNEDLETTAMVITQYGLYLTNEAARLDSQIKWRQEIIKTTKPSMEQRTAHQKKIAEDKYKHARIGGLPFALKDMATLIREILHRRQGRWNSKT